MVSNWLLSLAEDVFVIGLGILTMSFPVAANERTTRAVRRTIASGPLTSGSISAVV